MTAPRQSARNATRPQAPRRRPSSLLLALMSMTVALAMPIGIFAVVNRFEAGAAQLVGSIGVVFAVMWLLLWATKRQAGAVISVWGISVAALVAAGIVVAAYAGIGYAWEAYREAYNDFASIEILMPLGGMVLATFVVVYGTLSMARS